MRVGDIILCRDFTRFQVVEAPNKELALLNLDTYEVRYMNDTNIDMYTREYHLGIADIRKFQE